MGKRAVIHSLPGHFCRSVTHARFLLERNTENKCYFSYRKPSAIVHIEMDGSSGRVPISDIEKNAIRSATVKHNREIPLIIHQLNNNEKVDLTVRQLYSFLEPARARKRVYDFLQREVKK